MSEVHSQLGGPVPGNGRLAGGDALIVASERIAVVAHAMRNSLTSLRIVFGSVEKALCGDARHEQYLRVMRDEIERLDRLSRSLVEG
ncbi:unnamed protein product, partial [marine sediment metagenome]